MRKPLALAVVLPLALAPMVAGPAQAESIVKYKKLQKDIRTTFKNQKNINVTVACPKKVTWVKGKTFYCKVSTQSGEKGRILVTLRSGPKAGFLKWKLV